MTSALVLAAFIGVVVAYYVGRYRGFGAGVTAGRAFERKWGKFNV